MKVVILAAGAGKRFRALNLPKCLTYLNNGKSLLEYQLNVLSKYISLDKVIVVVGYHKERIMEQFPDLLYVYNPDFADENTSKSLLRALRKIENEDVLWINGDVVFKSTVIEAILHTKRNSMIVNTAFVGDEEVKYCTNRGGRILEVSKEVSKPQGEALGVNLFTKGDLDILKRNLEKCHATDYFEKAIELCISEEVRVWSVVVGQQECTEIDFPEDLQKANAILK